MVGDVLIHCHRNHSCSKETSRFTHILHSRASVLVMRTVLDALESLICMLWVICVICYMAKRYIRESYMYIICYMLCAICYMVYDQQRQKEKERERANPRRQKSQTL